MKKSILFILLLFSASVLAQTIDTRKTIEVTGSAEMSIVPDEIELEIILLEYNLNGKKVTLSNIEDDFNKILIKNNIDTKSINLEASNNNWYWWHWWNYRYESYHTKTIHLKLNKETNFLKLVEDLNKKWTQSIRISKTTSKEIQRLRKEVKKEAMRAAKEKATYLLESVDETIGSLLSAEEMPETQNAPNFWYNSPNLINNVSNSVMNSNSFSSSDNGIENVGNIKLRYEIKVKFEIK